MFRQLNKYEVVDQKYLSIGAADKEADEEEGTTGSAAPTEDNEDEDKRKNNILPLTSHQPVM